MKGSIKKPVIGLVGGIGSGKSSVASQLESLGCGLIQADDLAREAMDQPQVIKQLTDWWGPQILDKKGVVDRRAVAKRVFASSGELDRLESLLHPLVNQARGRLAERYQVDPTINAIVEDTPLLIEKGLDSACDFIIFVETDRQTRLHRLIATRDWTAGELDQREKLQVGVDIKAAMADYVVVNNDGKDECLAQVRHVLSQILQEDNPV